MTSGWSSFPLTDQNWVCLKKIHGLPDGARSELENILGRGKFLAELRSKEVAPSETKSRIRKLHRKAAVLLADLRKASIVDELRGALIAPPEATWTSQSALDSSRLGGQRFLDGQLESLRSLTDWLKAATTNVPRGANGDKTFHALAVTKDVDLLLSKHLGKGFTSSEKHQDPHADFLEACFEIIGIELTASAMIRRIVREGKSKVLVKQK